jgi:hypothetical protein
MKKGKWSIIVDDKRIVKQYDEGSIAGIGYVIESENFWLNNLNSNIRAIQYSGISDDTDQVEYRDGTHNSSFTGNIKIFSDEWDKKHLEQLQLIWDNNNIYETISNPNSTPENPKPDITVTKKETTEQKTSRVGPRPISYVSQDIY